MMSAIHLIFNYLMFKYRGGIFRIEHRYHEADVPNLIFVCLDASYILAYQ